MPKYASSTNVSIEKSRAEIERTLSRYGATGFMYGWMGDRHMLAFEMAGRKIRLELQMPGQYSQEIKYSSAGRARGEAARQKAYDQAVRQRWRAFALVLKAKLEAIEAGITTFESEFLHGTLLPSGQTVGEWLEPQIEHVYRSGQMPPLLPGPQD